MIKKLSIFLPVFGIIIFLFIIYTTGVGKIIDTFSKINILYLVIGVPFFIALITLLRGYKWRLIINSLGIDYSLLRSSKIILIGFFTGFITPGRVGDAIRSIYLKNDKKITLPEAFSTVFVDRIMDIVIVLVMGITSAIILSGYFSKTMLYGLMASAVLLLVVLYLITKKGTAMILLKPVYSIFVPNRYKTKIADNFEEFYKNISKYKDNKKSLIKIALLSIFNWLVIFTYAYAIAVIAGLKITPAYIILISPLIVLAETIPISISGLGTREAAMIFFLSFVNIESSLAISYSLLYMVLGGWTFSLIGAIFWMKEPVRINV